MEMWWADKDMIKYFEELYANIRVKNAKGQTLLHVAVENNRYKALIYLSSKLDTNETSNNLQTPLIHSIVMEYFKQKRYLNEVLMQTAAGLKCSGC